MILLLYTIQKKKEETNLANHLYECDALNRLLGGRGLGGCGGEEAECAMFFCCWLTRVNMFPIREMGGIIEVDRARRR